MSLKDSTQNNSISGPNQEGMPLYSLWRHSSVFHHFLKSLAVFDFIVVLGCLWMYSLPIVSTQFYKHAFLPTVPVILPIVQGGNLLGLFWPKKQPQYQPENRPEVPFEKDTCMNFLFWTFQAAFRAVFLSY